jgi:hypothetical protein
LRESVETHFVPAWAGVRSDINASETMKHRRQHQNARCYEFITTGQINLRFNRWGERDQAGLDRIAGWSFSQTSRVTGYTNYIPRFPINGPMKIGAATGAKVVMIPSQPARRICGKTGAAFCSHNEQCRLNRMRF